MSTQYETGEATQVYWTQIATDTTTQLALDVQSGANGSTATAPIAANKDRASAESAYVSNWFNLNAANNAYVGASATPPAAPNPVVWVPGGFTP